MGAALRYRRTWHPEPTVRTGNYGIAAMATRIPKYSEVLPMYVRPPWRSHSSHERLSVEAPVAHSEDERKRRVQLHDKLYDTAADDPELLLIYCDGSRQGTPPHSTKSGAAAVWFHKGQLIRDNAWSLGPGQHATDCEIAALTAVAWALARAHHQFQHIREIRIFTDCDPALAMLRCPTLSPGLAATLRTLDGFKHALHHLTKTTISVEWLPGHEGILGNEMADASCTHIARQPVALSGDPVPSLRFLKESHAVAARSSWIQEWRDYLVRRPHVADSIPTLPSTRPSTLLMGSSCSRTSVACQLASGHALTGAYAERFNLQRLPRACPCRMGYDDNPSTVPHHLLTCRKSAAKALRRRIWFAQHSSPPPTELATWFRKDGIPCLHALLKEPPPTMLGLFGRPDWLQHERPP